VDEVRNYADRKDIIIMICGNKADRNLER